MKRIISILLLLAVSVSLCACFLDPAESLYAVPKQSDDYNNLQSAIEAAMPDGASYSPPVSGDNQQAVQMIDLDGDGADEAIVFMKTSAAAPMLLSVFQKQDDRFVLLSKIEGAGSAFGQVQYIKFDDRPGYEIALGRQISDQVLQILSVYTLVDGGLVELGSANYSHCITDDLNADGLQDIVVIRSDVEGQRGIAELYHWGQGQLLREREALLSTNATAVKRVISGNVYEKRRAVFVAQEYGEGGIITDIFTFRGGVFSNISSSDETGTSVSTVRDYYVYSSDIDGDGLIELPQIIPLPEIEGDENSKSQSLVQWFNLSTDGKQENKALTYYNHAAGWYLDIENSWKTTLCVTRGQSPGASPSYEFYLADAQMLLSIASVTGEDAAQQIEEAGWTVLTQKGDVYYACLLGLSGERLRLSYEEIRAMFHFIHEDWKTGETG
ncbi:MAG: hypothetical protein LBM28_06025 [Oscillospiraceae bacterium]|jgi:hypothetical protein|nr:hypothetical protein [Oscillospiraceae bacterium]